MGCGAVTDTFLVVTAEDGGGLGIVGGAAMEKVHRDTKLGGGGGGIGGLFCCCCSSSSFGLFVYLFVLILFWWWRWWFVLFCFLRVDVSLT